jgi:ferritin-like metal-binding protein YciE
MRQSSTLEAAPASYGARSYDEMQTAHELYIHELNDMFSAEQMLLEALQEQAEAASNAQLKKAFESHRDQTQKQVERLQRCFEEIGESPEDEECKGMKGLIEEFRSFVQEKDPSPDILDHFACGAAAKVEQYEIKGYESLIELAENMEHNQAVKLLNQSLKEEQSTLEKMEKFSEKLQPENMGMEEMQEEDEMEEAGTSRSNASRGSSRKKSRGSARGRSRKAA